MNPIDWTKPVRTKGGKVVRILCTDSGLKQPVIGIVDWKDGSCKSVETWKLDGRWLNEREDDNDLENIPERIKRTVWINVYPGSANSHDDESSAQRNRAITSCLGCVKVELDFPKGEGL